MSAAPASHACLPVLDAFGHQTGASLEVPEPPPRLHTCDGVDYELRQFRECRQFGCGCLWEERVGYVAAAPPVTTNDESEGR